MGYGNRNTVAEAVSGPTNPHYKLLQQTVALLGPRDDASACCEKGRDTGHLEGAWSFRSKGGMGSKFQAGVIPSAEDKGQSESCSRNPSGSVCLEPEPNHQPPWHMPVILALRRVRQEEHQAFEDSLGCIGGEEKRSGQSDGEIKSMYR